MAAQAAARCGAGYVRLVTSDDAAACARTHLLSIPVTAIGQNGVGGLGEACVSQAREALAKSDVLLLGPGMGDNRGTEGFMRSLGFDRPVVLDADALNVIARFPDVLPVPATHPRILTPHEGEAARLLGRPVRDRRDDALQIAREYDAVVVLKGPQTLVASPLGELRLIDEGGPELAKAGTGDVLGGMIAAFWCQGLDAFDAATLAVFVHGRTGARVARELSRYAVTPEDIISGIGPTLLSMEASSNS